LFVPIAWALAGELLPPPGPDAKLRDNGARATRVLVFTTLVAQGYLQLYFGYVENYTFLALALAAYALTALRALDGRAPLLAPAACLVLALALHLSAAVVVPSFIVLDACRLLSPRARVAALRDLA